MFHLICPGVFVLLPITALLLLSLQHPGPFVLVLDVVVALWRYVCVQPPHSALDIAARLQRVGTLTLRCVLFGLKGPL